MRIDISRMGTISDLVTGERWTAAELAVEVASRSATLASLGVGPGRRVVLAHGGTPRFFADLFAVWSAGGCAVCINPKATSLELLTVAAFVDTAVIVASEGTAGLDTTLPCPVIGTNSDGYPRKTGFSGVTNSRLDDSALILFTSGTTGQPKGVLHTFRSLFARISLNVSYIGQHRLRTSLCVLPTHFGHGLIGNCLTPLFAGADLLLFPSTGIESASRLGTLLTDHDVTFLSSVPAYWRLATKLSKSPSRASLEQVHIGSAPLSADLWHRVIAWSGCGNVVNMYGITETANWIAGASSLNHQPRDGLVGAPWGGNAAVIDEAGELSAAGDGDIVVQTPSLMSGYFRRDDLTEAAMADGWYRTGDIGHIGTDGTIVLTGRTRNEINRAGIKIHPEEIDLLLERNGEILEACTFGVPDAISGEIVAAAIVLSEGSALDAGALRKWCSAQIRDESIPERWFFLPEIPKTDRGKVNRDNVRRYCLETATGRAKGNGHA